MHRLIQQVFVRHFTNPALRRMEDAAVLSLKSTRIALTTDSYVVQPLFFPGGDIGKLAVCGTVNDLSVMGATPRYLSAGFIISAGFPLAELERICRSMAATAKKAGVEIVTGDTKVVGFSGQVTEWPSGQVKTSDRPITGSLDHWTTRPPASELYINTSGVGVYDHNLRFGAEHIRSGDRILINGSIGDHEAAIVLARGEFEFTGTLKSDCAPLNGLIQTLISSGAGIRMMRDPTRGGVATTLNEIAQASGLGIIIDEASLNVRPKVLAVCALLGFEPLYLANEGKVLIVVAPDSEDKAISALRRHPLGSSAAAIAEVTGQREGVWLKTRLGSLRPVLMLEGQQLPRIC
jgi:hydrogenase expression/formation protein HypE